MNNLEETLLTDSLVEKSNNDKKDIDNMISTSKKHYKKEEKNSSKKIKLSNSNNSTKKLSINENSKRLNEDLLEMLEKMENLMKKQGDFIRSRIYSRAQDTILSFEGEITDINQLEGKPNIGPTIMAKMNEYVKTGTLMVLEREKENPVNWLTEIHGIGPKKAKDLVDKGITTIDQLREKKEDLLNNVQKIGLQYYEDTNKRIPREEIDEYKKMFDKEFKKVANDDSKYEIVGSYRRGARTSGDIDVIITSKNQDIFKTFVDSLKDTGIILETLSYGNTKALVIAKLTDKPTARRVDFLYSPPEEYPFAVLYFTGSKAFNTVMRGYALRMGVSLNEHGFYEKQKGKEKGEKLKKIMNSEEDIFEFLHLKYKKPEHRIDGRSVETTLAIIEENENTEKKSPSCYNSCETVPKGECATGCSPSWTSDKLIKTRNYCTCNIEGTDCKVHICNEQEKLDKILKQSKEKKKRTKKEPKEKKAPGEKRKYTRKIKIDKREPVSKNSPKTLKIDAKELPDIEPIIKYEEMKVNKGKNNKGSPKTKLNLTKKREINIVKDNIDNNMDAERAKLLFDKLTKEGFTAIENLDEKELENMIKVANDKYYNKEPLATDNEYDIVKEYLERKFPRNQVVKEIGAKVKKFKVTLPYEMPSMDKIKPDTNALPNWKSKYNGPYVLSCKLDGVSGMYSTEGDQAKLYTRGDGKIGQDITHLLSVLNLPDIDGHVVRGEFIILKSVFEEKYAKKFANPRNLVSGIINSKKIDEKAKDLHFVAYEVIKPELKPSDQMKLLQELNFEVVKHQLEKEITNDLLSDILLDWRNTYEYEMDGVIVANDKIHMRKSGNPDHAFAFKMVISDQLAEAKVIDVLWTPSKSGFLKPRVRIEPIRLGGVTIEYATGFNGNFIETNKIGVGAIITIIRSGDVIPYIKSITVPAEQVKMPDVPYHWNDTHVDIILDNVSQDVTVLEKNITAFFTTLGVDGLSAGNVKRLMKAGFNSVSRILHMKKEDYENVEGFKEKMINKIYNGIQDKIKSATLIDIMVASNLFGRGIGMKKIKPIMETYPNILTTTENNQQKMDMLMTVPNIGKENAKSFVENIDRFKAFLKEAKLESKLDSKSTQQSKKSSEKKESINKNHPLYGKKIVMTKVRDKYIIEQLEKIGATMENTMGKSTDILIVKSHDDDSNKVKKAKEMKLPIFTPAEFVKKYDL